MDIKSAINDIIENKKEKFTAASDKIWGYAETRFDVKNSADALIEVLTSEGFDISRCLGGMDHAFVASYGSGEPVIGILAEYDALRNMNQVADLAEEQQEIPGGNGHGCGHHALGAGAVAGAVAIKDIMVAEGLTGTVKLFGCPSEESGYGKAFMARAGAFDGLDGILTWHPMDMTATWTQPTLAVYQLYFKFKGRAAHAGASPEQGRSALDAAELMNVGVNFLREHIIDEARIHYAFIDAGGESANVVQPSACLYYFIRAPKTAQVQEIFERVEKIAKGAALMTETEMEMIWDSACADYLPNEKLSRLVQNNLEAYVPYELRAEDLAYEQPFFDSFGELNKEGILKRTKGLFPEKSEEEQVALAESPIFTAVAPYNENPKRMTASTDVGDPSWIAPTAQFTIACFPQGAPAHSWQWVATGKSSPMHKGLLTAGKVLALTAYEMLTKPEILAAAKDEHAKTLGDEVYHSAIPDEVVPA